MKIQAKLRVYALAALGLILVVSTALLLVGQQIRTSLARKQMIRHMLQNNAERNALLTEYLANPEAQVHERWEEALRSLNTLLTAYPLYGVEDTDIVTAMAKDSQSLAGAFADEGNDSVFIEASDAASARIVRVNALSIARRSLSERSLQLSEANEKALWASFQKARFFIVLFVFLLTLLMLGIIYLINRNVGEPLKKLTTAARQMSQGTFGIDLPHELLEFQDEVGELSHAFADMAHTVRDSQANLEQKVKEKTDALAEKIMEMERLNKLMIGRELKMIELKKEIGMLKKIPVSKTES